MTALAPTLQAFFTERLIRQRQASPHTLAAYRDTLRLLLVFASARKDVEPSKLDIDDLDAPLIPAALITGIRSDLPGQITAQITEPIFDSPTGRAKLIPQGATTRRNLR